MIRVALALPWYAGADRDCVATFLANQHYLGRLQERLAWIAEEKEQLLSAGINSDLSYPPGMVNDLIEARLKKMPPLDAEQGWSEVPRELYGTRFQFGIGEQIGWSLPGKARDRCVDAALAWGADYLWFFDSDMRFGTDMFLRLYLADKPVVAALAFTGRKPITPVIYRFTEEVIDGKNWIDIAPVADYERDALQKVNAIGSGVMLIKADVFKTIPKPWFDSTGCGEDIHFCFRCRQFDIPVYVETRAKTWHKPTFHDTWHSEDTYLEQIAQA